MSFIRGIIIILFIGGGILVLNGGSFHIPLFQKEITLQEIKENIERLGELQGKIFTPPPLKSTKDAARSFLTREGVFAETNKKRVAYNLSQLTLHATLNRIAEIKAQDMFAREYFEHVAPDGTGVSDLAKRAGYDFIVIGENLALGNFANDAELIDAWMNSPGHRANILKDAYTEI